MTRRSLLGMLAAAVVAPFAPKIAAKPIQRLAFHPDAFALAVPQIHRFDVLYGFGTLSSNIAVHLVDDPNDNGVEFGEADDAFDWSAMHGAGPRSLDMP